MEKEEIKILYIDDDEDDYLLVQSLLKKVKRINYTVDRATGLTETLELLDAGYEVFLVDYRLGIENGLDVLRAIRQRKQYAPVIMLTGMEDGEVDQLALNEGAADYLVKGDFDAQILERTIRYALRDAMLIETLEISASRFRNIFEKSADPIVLIEDSGRIIKANPSFNRLFGLEENEQGNTISFENLLLNKEHIPVIRMALARGQALDDFETTMLAAREKRIQALISLVMHDSYTGSYQVMIKDLTALREREEEKHSFAKFASTGRMARIIAHEVKNPLTNITLSSDQLKAELPPEVLQETGDLIAVIDRNAGRINQLVSELLHSTRFTDLQICDYDINRLLDETLEMAADRMEFRKIEVEKNYAPEIPLVLVDPDKVRIAFLNIIVNAIEAMEKSEGKIRIETEATDGKCLVRISDNGPGIAQDQLDRLFEPFFTSKEKGTGLGLTNTQNIILSHQGTIRVQSEPGAGTSFIIAFNLHDGTALALEASS